jgi:hypothetical protein
MKLNIFRSQKQYFIYTYIVFLIFPNNIFFNENLHVGFVESFDFYYTNYFYSGIIYSFPISLFFLIPFSILYINNNDFLRKKNYDFFFIIFYSFLIIVILFFFQNLNIKILKNIINLNIFLFLLFFFDFFLKDNIKISRILIFYQLILSFLCLLILINKNINIFYFVPESFLEYISITGYDSQHIDDFFLNLKVTSYLDYFSFVILLGIISAIVTFKNNRIISIFNIYIFTLQLIYLLEFNTGLILCFFLFAPLVFFFYFLRLLFKKKYYIYYIILFLYLFYWTLIYSGLIYDLHPSIDKRITLINYMTNQLNLNYFLFPFFLIKEEGNMHNDFIDMFFSFGPIFVIYFYYLLSRKIKIIYFNNIFAFTLFFLILFFEGLVQNNQFSLYLNTNLAFILSSLIHFFKKKNLNRD